MRRPHAARITWPGRGRSSVQVWAGIWPVRKTGAGCVPSRVWTPQEAPTLPWRDEAATAGNPKSKKAAALP